MCRLQYDIEVSRLLAHNNKMGTIKKVYYMGIAGNIGFIILYMVTRFPGNPVNGRSGDVNAIDMICEVAQVAYLGITAVILSKETSIKAVKEQLG
jgi:hypothetical protein